MISPSSASTTILLPCVAVPRLTTVRQDVEAKGRAAAQALLALVAGRADVTLSRPRSRRLPVQLEVRGSTSGGVQLDR